SITFLLRLPVSGAACPLGSMVQRFAGMTGHGVKIAFAMLPKQLSRLLLAGLLVAIAACKKDRGSAHATLFYGMWIKGSQTGDTLYFFQSNGKNIVRYPASPNPAAPSYQEEEFGYKNGKL